MDHGKGFNPEKVADPTEGDSILKTSGRGIAIMKDAMDCVTFNKQGNEVTLFITKESLKKTPLAEQKRGERRRVLIIDDEHNIVSLFKLVLVNSGYEVEESSDPLYGMVLVGEFKPDLLILDLRMPDIDGSEISRKLKESKVTQHIKILIVSGFLPPVSTLSDMHADDFLAKPVGLNRLVERVGRLLS